MLSMTTAKYIILHLHLRCLSARLLKKIMDKFLPDLCKETKHN